jgi:predicted SnoaL-like aldol condensation-catalyzing enzyme
MMPQPASGPISISSIAHISNQVAKGCSSFGLILAEGDYVIVHGRFSGMGRPAAFVAADVVRIEDGLLAEHWDVLQDEATQAESKSGLPMFGDRFPS